MIVLEILKLSKSSKSHLFVPIIRIKHTRPRIPARNPEDACVLVGEGRTGVSGMVVAGTGGAIVSIVGAGVMISVSFVSAPVMVN